MAYGDGTILRTFPREVMLRKRCVTRTLGVVWEFPWYCACVAGAAGSGGGTVIVSCCPNPISSVLIANVFGSNGACDALWNGSYRLVFNGIDSWVGTGPVTCVDSFLGPDVQIRYTLVCDGFSGKWYFRA